MLNCLRSFILLSFFLAVHFLPVITTPRNYTIDDTFGDSRTGQMAVYKPSTLWGNQTCYGCAILPDTAQMMNGTYHEATWNPGKPQLSITINFNGKLLVSTRCRSSI